VHVTARWCWRSPRGGGARCRGVATASELKRPYRVAEDETNYREMLLTMGAPNCSRPVADGMRTRTVPPAKNPRAAQRRRRFTTNQTAPARFDV
jgi:hypothetical protein